MTPVSHPAIARATIPPNHIPKLQEAARDKYAEELERLRRHYASRNKAQSEA